MHSRYPRMQVPQRSSSDATWGIHHHVNLARGYHLIHPFCHGCSRFHRKYSPRPVRPAGTALR